MMDSLFARIMAVVLCVIFILAAALGVLSYYSLRNQRINARLDYLSSEASDIAYLAGDVDGGGAVMSFFQNSRRYLSWKAKNTARIRISWRVSAERKSAKPW